MKMLIIQSIVVTILLVTPKSLHADETPHCHVYIDTSGLVFSYIKQIVKVRYDKSQLCESLLRNHTCYSYFETKEKCVKEDNSLIELFLKDAKADGNIID
ncbi:hypothetical protein OAU_17755 [Vibrio cyclitrophicus ZF99]|nr:hypothetical protein OAU_17755 [Vibrio cyclitrophicus ZF99]PME13731.1 hypothetical protein BCV43_18110 [Vibrio cyclitrophicus]